MRISTITNWAYGITVLLTVLSGAAFILSAYSANQERITVQEHLVLDDRDNQNPNPVVVDSPANTLVVERQPCQAGAIGETGDDKKTELKSRGQQSSVYVMDVPREFPKTLLANANETTLTILFWVFLISTMVNTLSTTSAIILAWMSNNRAKAELVLKQADALREAKERDLRIKELELKVAQLERPAPAPSGIVVVTS